MKENINMFANFKLDICASEGETESCSVMSNSLRPHGPQFMEFSRPEYWRGQTFLSPVDLPNPGIKPRSPTLQADSLPAEPQGEPNTGVGSLPLHQQIFPTQELNQVLLHCRRILYPLSHKGSHIRYLKYSNSWNQRVELVVTPSIFSTSSIQT